MISRCTPAVFPKTMMFLPDCSSVIQCAPRLVISTPSHVAGAPTCFLVHLNGIALVQCTVGFDHPGILVRQLSYTPKGSKRSSYILLMEYPCGGCIEISSSKSTAKQAMQTSI